jgi:peptidoglycan-associated lipoprotein
LSLDCFAAAALTVGCSKKPVVSHEPPPAAPPAARPTVTLQANPTSMNKGDATTLSWSSTNATTIDNFAESALSHRKVRQR